MTRSPRAVFVTLLAGAVLTGLAGGAQAVPGSSQSATGATAAPPVLAPAKPEGAAPATAGVQKALLAALRDPSLGKHYGAYVYDASRNKTLYSVGTTKPFVPASTLKLLTTVAALEAIGPDHLFTTKTVRSGGSLVLVGGGDPLLTVQRSKDPLDFPVRATLQDLATRTAKALKADGVASVTLSYDATLFSGPAVNAKWQPNYVTEGIAAPTSALWVNEGRLSPGMAKRAPSPAQAAATSFAKLLRAAGITVAASVKPAKAPAAATEVATVRSAPLGDLVEYVNLHSDNDGAEVLLRQVGVATGNGGSYAGGIKGLRATLTKLGLDVSKARIEDGSGLSRTNQVPLDVLAGAVRVAVAQPELRHLISGLPVAGFTGSLAERFASPGTSAGTGFVRAKTGTLTGVHSLSGLVRTRTGTVLVFAVATDSVPADKPLQARAALDRASAALASCGCTG
ncbi:D-alanyl-D-alanine carboxypeptidase/D-alanyl-D-alanine-endopeptidase (penicillin-binding protein 4) [Kribbella amoyensis]|uniref:D-alanyl-D-alanine carboxypeptidase/D-alanyl-D-alanine-endopeptidase (Penicillin-binding protein 4) n=1 Tax=Kribbella amoyensis TaxID=996641 RepID=A0A561BLX5_9ACTN|nr:D-alanyl-D-alanine carboxypeptidase/D-alanyl-D-alanine-endopeptidase [Kribbella amoyensis]TWD79871.1 D-alanyl-D-alanine carboxypeptidase/D-alanyl-D-alanine-endopeptidase (penicillin-binding protein 4) [Kribbella amoyensis]